MVADDSMQGATFTSTKVSVPQLLLLFKSIQTDQEQISLNTHRWAMISFFTWSRASRKNRSTSVLWSRMLRASFFTLFISFVLSWTTRWSFVISVLDHSISSFVLATNALCSASNSRTACPSDCSRSSTFSRSWNYNYSFIFSAFSFLSINFFAWFCALD